MCTYGFVKILQESDSSVADACLDLRVRSDSAVRRLLLLLLHCTQGGFKIPAPRISIDCIRSLIPVLLVQDWQCSAVSEQQVAVLRTS